MQHPLSRLISYANNYRTKIRLATACSVLNKLFDLAPELLIGVAVDVVVKRGNSFLGRLGVESLTWQLILLGSVTVLVWILESVFEYAYALLWRNLAQTIEHDLRIDGYRHVQALDTEFFEDQSTGGLLAILNDDINQLERFLDTGANDLLQVATGVTAVSAIFFWLSPQVAWMALFPIPIILWGSFRFQNRIAPRYADVREKAGLLGGQLANNITGIVTIKSFAAEELESERIKKLSHEYRLSNSAAITLSSAFSPLIRMAVVTGFTGTLIFGGILALRGSLSVGAYSALVYLTQRLLWPLTRLGTTVDLYQRAMASTNRVLDLLDTPIRIQGGNTLLPRQEVKGHLRFEHISFAYKNGLPILKDISFEVNAGRTLAIVGPTGSGKSTLIKLLLRLYEPTEGLITLDGISLDKLKLQDLRLAMGLVSQDVFLFHGTVAENIAYGRPGASDTDIIQAARVAEADAFIRELSEGYATLVGERGQKLSGGQRQRVSIARAVLKDPPILILDEATSAVDNETEAAIQRSMETISKNRTTIVIAHRLSTVRHADQIMVLDQGSIVEQGTHDDLLNKHGVYAALWNVQTGNNLSAEINHTK